MKTLATLALLLVSGVSLTPEAVAQNSQPSAACGLAIGQTAKDVQNVATFCQRSIVKAGAVVSVAASDSLLFIKVNRLMAQGMRADRLAAEQLVLNWMRAWKEIIGRKAVTVTVEWQDVQIAEGQTTLFSGDRVTFR